MINNGSHTFSKVISTNYQVLSLVPLKQCAGITICLINLISAKLLKVWSVKLAKKYVKNFKWFLGGHIKYIFIYIYKSWSFFKNKSIHWTNTMTQYRFFKWNYLYDLLNESSQCICGNLLGLFLSSIFNILSFFVIKLCKFSTIWKTHI